MVPLLGGNATSLKAEMLSKQKGVWPLSLQQML